MTARQPANAQEPRRVVLYARVSTIDKGQNPDVQLDPLRDYAKARGWKVVGEYVDRGVSGAKTSRPKLDELMQAVDAGLTDIVLVWKFDRFARSTRHLLDALAHFRGRSVDFVSITENIDTATAMGRAVFTILAAIAELERELIKERVLAGMAEAKRKGKKLGRPMVVFDIRLAGVMLRSGEYSLVEVAEAMKVSPTTIRRKLAEAGLLTEDA